MKTKMAALALLLTVGAAPQALAQEYQHDHEGRPAEAAHPHNYGGGGGEHAGRPAPSQAPAPAAAPRAQQAPTAPQPRQNFGGQNFGGRWGGQHQGQPAQPQPEFRGQTQVHGQDRGRPQGQPQPGNDDGRRFVRRPSRWVDTDGDDTSQGLLPADRADQEDRDELRQFRRFYNDRGAQGGDPRRFDNRPSPGGDDRRGQDGRSNGAGRGEEHRAGDHREGDRRGGDNHGRPQWRPGAFPHAYLSQHRFHVRDYRRPTHFFVRHWGFGEILPPTWYGSEHLLQDWWGYDLPAPPPGYEWVRVGDDALLIDGYTGRVVQVVRELFW